MMNSSDYIEVEVSIDPFSEENAEILEAMLSDLPYDSFEIGEGSVKCYIQQPLFDRRALRTGRPAVRCGVQGNQGAVPELECPVGEFIQANSCGRGRDCPAGG